MHLLQIEHRINDFDTWKGAFDRFSGMRPKAGPMIADLEQRNRASSTRFVDF